MEPCLLCHGFIGIPAAWSANMMATQKTWPNKARRRLGVALVTRAQSNARRARREGRHDPARCARRRPKSVEQHQWVAWMDEQREWREAERAVCWSKNPDVKRLISIAAYYANHEKNKIRSRLSARQTYQKRKNDPAFIAKRKEQQARWNKKNRSKKRDQFIAWRNANPEKWKESRRRQSSRPINRVIRNVRSRLRDVLRGKRSAMNVVGCSKKELEKHLESKFRNGMTWDNYGTFWHVDHIVPVSHFDLSSDIHAKLVHHWTNLRPLEAIANIRRGNRLEASVQVHLPI